MNNIFNPDNKIMIAIGRVGDYMLLGVLWTICSLPIITIGASTTALFYSSLKILANEDTYLFKDYFHSFKQNFKQATILWLIMLVAGIFCVADLYFYMQLGTTLGNIGFCIFVLITVLYVLTMLYLFPYLSKFYCTNKQAFQSALLLSIRHLGYTVLMIVADVAVLILSLYFTFLILFLPALLCFVNSLIFKRIFKRYIPETPEEGNGDDFMLIDEIEERDAMLAAVNAARERAAAEASEKTSAEADEETIAAGEMTAAEVSEETSAEADEETIADK